MEGIQLKINRLLLSFLICLAAFASVSESNSLTQSKEIEIFNFGKIADHYYRGSQPKGYDYINLREFGIKTVINLTSHDTDPYEKKMAESAGMNYFHIPMTTRKVPTVPELSEFLSIVNDPSNQPVYVHCVEGRHRTGVMTAVYRMTQDGWSADQAYEEMKKYKFGPSFLHPEFKKFVYEYYSKLPERRKTTEPQVAASAAN